MTADWPTDPRWYLPPAIEDFDDRETLEILVCRSACWQRRKLDRALSTVAPRDFRHGTWRTIWEAIEALAEDRQMITADVLADHLATKGLLATIGGMQTILRLCDPAYPGADPAVFGSLLAEWARRDRLKATLASAEVVDGTLDVDALAERLAEDANPEFVAGIDRVEDVREAIIDRIAGVAEHEGFPTGLLDSHYRVGRGDWTVVTGIPGSGKSSVLDQILINLAKRHGWHFAIFSPEASPTDRHATKLATMHQGRPLAACTSADVETSLKWVNEHFTWINSTDGIDIDEILRRADVIHRRKHVDGLVVDPWNEIDRGSGRYESEHLRISEGLTKFRRWARRRSAHLWLVAHPTKLQKNAKGEYETPTLYDISGSATWRDKADMGLVVHRDQARGGPTDVHVVKVRQRAHGRLGTVRLVMDTATERFAAQARVL